MTISCRDRLQHKENMFIIYKWMISINTTFFLRTQEKDHKNRRFFQKLKKKSRKLKKQANRSRFKTWTVYHRPPYVHFHSCVFADGHRPDESVRIGDEPLLEVQRVVIEIDQLGHNFEGDEKIDWFPVPDSGSVLDQIRAWVGPAMVSQIWTYFSRGIC